MKTYHTIESLNLKSLERSSADRAGFPRYLVNVDCDLLKIETPAKLRRVLASIYSETPKVFVNAGNGLTIDFS